uniref:hyaluronan-binding protein 2-like n=1 Tax=Styela clava TaxID=7725 RepID=UPI0019396BB0|nr:hyaluronan-binding protein 2-like [Styela clava]
MIEDMMTKERLSSCLLFITVTLSVSQASVPVYLHTYETTPKYVKGSKGNPATCSADVSDALKFNILEPGLTATRGESSFKTLDFTRHYLVDVDAYIYINRYDGRRSFERAGSFTTKKNHFFKGTTAYESTEYPNQFLMCKSGQLVLEKVKTSKEMGRASFITAEVSGVYDDNWTPCTKPCGGGIQKPKKRTCISAFWCEEERTRPCNTFKCKEKDICDSNPCLNGGACRATDGTFHCLCRPGYRGERCERKAEKNPCLPNPCKNRGSCLRTGSIYVCRCRAGFSGKHCETANLASCNPNPCANGKCTEAGTRVICDCNIGYYGDRCQIELKLKQWSPCSKLCGGGTRYRSKSSCKRKKVKDCPREYGDCNTKECPDVNCPANHIHRFQTPSSCCKKSRGSECGSTVKSSVVQRVIGGVVSKPKMWPSMAAIYQKSTNEFFCGGIIIHKQWILTAGHCAEAYPATDLKILVGTTHRDNLQSTHQWAQASKIFLHPNYKNPVDDVALIKLKSPLKFNDAVRKVCLPNGEKTDQDLKCFAPGWGVAFKSNIPTREGSPVLKHVGLRTLPLDACVQGYVNSGYSDAVTSRTLCAGLLSPLVLHPHKQAQLVDKDEGMSRFTKQNHCGSDLFPISETFVTQG